MNNEFLWTAIAIVFALAYYFMYVRGTTLGFVDSTFVGLTGSTHRIRFVVKRHASSKPNALPRASLGVRVAMASTMYTFSAIEARRLADAIDHAAGTGGITPFTDTRLSGIAVSRCFDDGSVGASLGVNVAENLDVVAEFIGQDARKLATLLRVAAAPGATIAQARVNARPKQPV